MPDDDGLEVRVLRAGDEAVLERVAPGVFDNPIDPALAREFLAAGCSFVAVGVDITLLARATSALAARFKSPAEAAAPARS